MTDLVSAALEKHGITVKAEFVPFSRSRNADQTDDKGKPVYSLNWKVTLQRNGRDIMTTDYSAGIAHCPGYAVKSVPSTFVAHGYRTHDGKPYAGTASMFRTATPGEKLSQYRNEMAGAECESGFPMELDPFGRVTTNNFKRKPKSEAIRPDTASVVYCLIMDSSVLDSGGFDEWAGELGYDVDSRKAETIYRECLEMALKLRAGLGEETMSELRTAFQDF